MNFELYIARRYLFSKKSTNAINVISIISMIGVAVATMALVIVLIILKANKGKKKSNSKVSVAASGASSSQRAHGTTVTLRDVSGAVLKSEMKGGRLTIGRDASRGAMLAIPSDGRLSGVHVTLTKQGESMTITDNNSTNGTKVNGTKITGTVPLHQNDSVSMGSNTYTVSWH